MVELEAPEKGAIALHRSGHLDSRQVARVSEDGQQIWLNLLGDDEYGPYPAANYTFKRREWK